MASNTLPLWTQTYQPVPQLLVERIPEQSWAAESWAVDPIQGHAGNIPLLGITELTFIFH
ncbi:MAG TPA: hypothetical protein VKK79_21255 [Candidatus Lokiarchaeia archaeon]|nr:hypothetical protein [Candidatus Lokiarchaeia archaeon]